MATIKLTAAHLRSLLETHAAQQALSSGVGDVLEIELVTPTTRHNTSDEVRVYAPSAYGGYTRTYLGTVGSGR